MDLELFTVLVVLCIPLFLLLSFAKDSKGKRYGFARMARLWLYALPYLVFSFLEFHYKGENGAVQEIKLPYSTVFLLVLPIGMVFENIREKKKRANQEPEPTSLTRCDSSLNVGQKKEAMPTSKTISKQQFMWRFGLMFSILLLVLGVVMALFGRIDYQYHYGNTQVIGVIRREDAPFRFWAIIGTIIAVGTASTIITSAGYSRGHFRNRSKKL
jgi:hypothetical protein